MERGLFESPRCGVLGNSASTRLMPTLCLVTSAHRQYIAFLNRSAFDWQKLLAISH